MSTTARILDLLPPPFTDAPDSTLAQLIGTLALELEVIQEDIDRMRRSHWVEFVERLVDLEKLAALLGITRLPWETLPTFRDRLLALVTARLRGALGPGDICAFGFDYLTRTERTLDAMLVPGLRSRSLEQAFAAPAAGSAFRPLALVENPKHSRFSAQLRSIAGRVPYLFRWTETNGGLDESAATFRLTGFPDGRSASPVLINQTTGDLIGYAGTIPLGRTLVVGPASGSASPRQAEAFLDGRDVTASLWSLGGVVLGAPFERQGLDPSPLLPRMARGENRWIALSVGIYDVKGLDHVYFALADDELCEGAFDQSTFDHALFPSGPVMRLEMAWEESEPASFELCVPRYLVSVSSNLADLAAPGESPYEQVADGLRRSILELHAAGVRAEVRFIPFLETQEQQVRVTLPWVVLPPEPAPAGRRDTVVQGGRFGETELGVSRFE